MTMEMRMKKNRGERAPRLGVSGQHAREKLNAEIVQAEADQERLLSLESTPDQIRLAELKVENAHLERRLFDESHDSTGAWKAERFGQDLRKEMNEDPYRLQESQFYIVNLGELDRLNSTGEHALGDQGLALTFDRIDEKVRAAIGMNEGQEVTGEEQPTYDIYRVTGNDFMVRVSRLDRDAKKAEQKAEALTQALNGRVMVKAGVEAAPVIADRVSWKEVERFMNSLMMQGTEVAEEDRPKAMIGLAKEMMQAKNDVSKLHDRMRRFIEMADDEKDQTSAKEFYEKYLQKSLGKMFTERPEEKVGNGLGYDKLKIRIDGLGAFRRTEQDQQDNRWERILGDVITEEAARLMQSRHGEARGVNKAITEIVASQVLDRKMMIDPRKKRSERTKKREAVAFQEPKKTRGKMALDALNQQVIQFQEEVTEAEGSGQEQVALAQERLRKAKLNVEIEKARRDTLTGLEQRGPMFGRMEEALKKDLPTAVMFIDMAFLKYFDKEGGAAVGNLAVRKSAEILDTVATRFTTKGQIVEAYRVGGDEFVITIIGASGDGTDTTEKIAAFLRSAEEEAGAIPEPENPVGDYQATRLAFNVGVQKMQNKNDLRERLGHVGVELDHKPGDPDENSECADYLVRLADKSLEIGKALNRMQYLVDLRRESIGDPSGRGGHYRSLLEYSKKALISDKAERQIEKWAKMPAAESQAILQEMITFVFEALKEKDEKAKEAEGSVERVLDEAIRRHFLDTQIAERQKYLAAMAVQHKREARVAQAQADLMTLKKIRESLNPKPSVRRKPPAVTTDGNGIAA